jgi:2-polyprenyl-6-methoxyphenol hydroxylase-like FAD-dependent oxidoreductase
MERVPVIIVGGGPVGLAAALELSRYGIGSLLVERHAGTTWHPKARNLNTRTMEIARGWGAVVHDELVSVNLPPGWTSQIIYTRTLAGDELGRMRTAGFSGRGPSVSPEIPLLSSQDIFEPIMRRGVEATGLSDVRFGHEAGRIERGAAEDDDRAVVEITERASGRKYEVEAEYLIAADGADSPVRKQLGVPLIGPQGLGHFVNVYFYGDLDPWTAERPAILYWVAHPGAQGVFQPLDARGRWLCQIAYDGKAETWEGYTPERCVEWIRTAIGDEKCDPEIRSIGTWTMNAAVAKRLIHGRVILAGDAAHQLPPTGGFGVNTGIQGVHNLVWKLALVRSGEAGQGLLETYDVERRAVGRFNADRSLENSRMVQQIAASAIAGGSSPKDAVAASKRYGNFLGMELGFWYESDAVVPDGTEPPEVEDAVIDYAPTGRPGHRAPHVSLERDGERTSILDLFGCGFTLLTGAAGQAWLQAATATGKRSGIQIRTHSIGASDDYVDPDGVWSQQYGVSDRGAVLVRPDGHVAWRSADGCDAAPDKALADVLGRVLARSQDASSQ